MSTSIMIRDVPDGIGRTLAAQAAATGRSLQAYLLAHLVDLARPADPEVVVARRRRRKESLSMSLPREVILAHRDAARR